MAGAGTTYAPDDSLFIAHLFSGTSPVPSSGTPLVAQGGPRGSSPVMRGKDRTAIVDSLPSPAQDLDASHAGLLAFKVCTETMNFSVSTRNTRQLVVERGQFATYCFV